MTQSEVNQTLVESVVPMVAPIGFVEQLIHDKNRLIELIVKVAIGLSITNLLVLLACGIFVNALFAGKVLVIEVMVGVSAVCLTIFKYQPKIMDELTHAEEIANLARDQAFVDLNMAREELRRLRHKLRRDTDEEGYAHVNELLKMVSPLVVMFIQKEKNILRWGMFGWKVAQNAMAVVKQRSKES